MHRLQMIFSIKLAKHILKDHEIIYIDESGCNSWAHNNRYQWQPRAQPHYVALSSDRASTEMWGAISTKQTDTKWLVHKGPPDHRQFLQFLEYIKDYPIRARKTLLVIDQAPYHKVAAVKTYIESLHWSVLVLPPSSSTLNPIGK